MEALPNGNRLPQTSEGSLLGRDHKKYRAFACFLIACGLMIAAFAVTAICMRAKEKNDSLESGDGMVQTSAFTVGATTQAPTQGSVEAPNEDKEPILPTGATPIIGLDLVNAALPLLNETPYLPDLQTLLKESEISERITSEPLVLILHTHTSEAYAKEVCMYFDEEIGNATYSADESRNVIVVGKTLADTLNAAGIPTLHCVTAHDIHGLSGSYKKSAESIRQYLSQYPSIRYVIDVHRDSIMTSEGEYVRSLSSGTAERTAQVMAVVGSDCNGTSVPNMDMNLALALRLKQVLNENGKTVCRSPFLKGSSYNQELAAHSLLLEIGTGANTVEEACRAAHLVGEALAVLIRGES